MTCLPALNYHVRAVRKKAYVVGLCPLHEVDNAAEVVADFPDVAFTQWLVQFLRDDHYLVADLSVHHASFDV